MPTVASYGARKVSTDALPGVRKTAAETPLSEGAGIAQAEEQRGQALFGVGNQVSKLSTQTMQLVDQQRKEANDIASLSAHTQLAQWTNQRLYDPNQGALNESGPKSFDLPERLAGEFNDQADKIAAGLGNDDQRLAFEKTRLMQAQDLDLTLRRHVFGEMQKNDTATVNASIETSRNAAISNALDPARVAAELDHQVATIEGFAKRRNLSPEVTESMINDARTKTHVGVLEEMLAEDNTNAAKVYFDETKHQINGDQIARIQKALEEGTLRKQSQSIADQIKAGSYGVRADGSQKGGGFLGALKRPDGSFSSELSIGVELDGKETEIPSLVPTLSADEIHTMLALKPGQDPPASVIAKAIDYARTRIAAGKSPFAEGGEADTTIAPDVERTTPGKPEPPSLREALNQAQAITDPKLRDQVEQRLEHAFAIDEKIDRQQSEAALKSAFDVLDRTPDVTKIPPTAWHSFTGAERSALQSYAEHLARGDKIQTDYTAWYAAIGRAADTPQAFAKENLLLLRPKLSDADFKQLGEMQLAMRRGETKIPAVAEFRTKEQILNDTLATYGIETRESKQTPEQVQSIAQLRRMVDERLEALSTMTGKKPTNDDIQKTLDGLLSQKTDVKGSWWNFWPGSGKPFFDQPGKPVISMTIGDITAPERQKIEDQLRTQGRPISDQTVLSTFIETKSREAQTNQVLARITPAQRKQIEAALTGQHRPITPEAVAELYTSTMSRLAAPAPATK